MFRQNAVFVIGAGTGFDIGMPMGADLAQQIILRTSNHRDSTSTQFLLADKHLAHSFSLRIKDHGVPAEDYYRASQLIAKGLILAPSIDEFLFVHSEEPSVQVLGKLAIARCILESERKSTLFFDSNRTGPNMAANEKSMLLQLFRLAQRRIKKGNEANIFRGFSILNFNYDRCIEHFLFYALQDFFNIKPNAAAEAMKTLKIYHPYGCVGSLPWQGLGQGIEFGYDGSDPAKLSAASKALRTFTEEVDDANLREIREVVESAETLIFLGFHYHLQNLELLRASSSAARVYGTVYGRSADEREVIFRRLSKFVRKNVADMQRAITLNPCMCADAFLEYGLTWTDLVEAAR